MRTPLFFTAFVVVCVCVSGCRTGSDRSPSVDGIMEQRRFAGDGLPGRDYLLYRPASLGASAPLLVYLHGCDQSAPDVAVGTRWQRYADQLGFAVIYPDQRDPNAEDAPPARDDVVVDGNAGKCWNWFVPDEVVRGQGEVGTIAAITQQVASELDSDPDRIFLMGLSAGAILTSAVLANYPELYSAGGVVAGCGYPYCSDTTGQPAYNSMGNNARRMPVIIFQGTADLIQPYPTSRETLQQWLGTNDYVDDGKANQSVSQTSAHQITYGLENIAPPQEHNPCVYARSYPCTAGTIYSNNSYPFTIELFLDANQCLLAEFWTIHGLGHNYPNGNTEGSYTDPFGPDINAAAWNFFISQTRGGVFDRPTTPCTSLF